MDMQPGDALRTCADISNVKEANGFNLKTIIEEGLSKYVDWYRDYYKI